MFTASNRDTHIIIVVQFISCSGYSILVACLVVNEHIYLFFMFNIREEYNNGSDKFLINVVFFLNLFSFRHSVDLLLSALMAI